METNYAAMSECEDCGDMPADTYQDPSGDGTEYTFCRACYERNLQEWYEMLSTIEISVTAKCGHQEIIEMSGSMPLLDFQAKVHRARKRRCAACRTASTSAGGDDEHPRHD